jgi:exopolyphosphatase / guanosine-5'-triphosphate,3'-diphosphate pyrophosphatase
MTKPPSTRAAVAVIDVGASAIRLVIAQYAPGERPQVLEEASRSVLLGRDTFAVGRIGATTTDAAVRALSGFRRMMDDYGVTRVRAVATSAVREAANCDTFLDRVRVRTGVEIEVIDGSEESRLTYLAVRDGLGTHAALAAPATLLVEVGGGSVDVTRLENGQPVQAGVFPLGAIRLRQRLGVWFGSHEQRIRLLTAQVDTTVGEIVTEVPVGDAAFVVALGSDMRFAAARLVENSDGSVAEIARAAFMEFAQNVEKCDEDELVSRYRLSPIDAETLVPALLVYRALIDATAAQTIVVPEVSLRAGLLVDLVGGSAAEADFAPQVLASAMTLGTRYRSDADHVKHVARLATQLFDNLAAEHGLGTRDRLLLEVAALLHDIGLFVSLRGHHKHSMYLLQASEIFGLTRDDMQIVANIARYHRRGLPQKSHPEFMRLDRDERVRVTKLAAILRLANALDAEHMQKVSDIGVHEEDGRWVIELHGRGDLTMERMAATSRADLLVDVFGKHVVVRGAGAGV